MAQTKEYEITHKLLYPLDRFQSLIDVEMDKLVQPVSNGCGTANCELGERCNECENKMMRYGRAESILVKALTEPEVYPCMSSEEVKPAMIWQLLLAAQQADTVIPYFVQQLMRDESLLEVSLDECSDEFKVLASQFKHLSITEEEEGELPYFFTRRRESLHLLLYARN